MTYHAQVERDGRFWYIRVPEIGRSTQARHLREVEAMARDLISIIEDVDPASFELEIHVDVPAETRTRLQRAERLRAQSARAQAAAAAELRTAARELHEAGMPLRDIGQLLGVSYQRAHQLVAGQPAQAA